MGSGEWLHNEGHEDMNETKDKVAASLTVYRVADMTAKGRKAVCKWLRKIADDLEREPEGFATRFRARYLYPAKRQER
jgi:hypothetical protein